MKLTPVSRWRIFTLAVALLSIVTLVSFNLHVTNFHVHLSGHAPRTYLLHLENENQATPVELVQPTEEKKGVKEIILESSVQPTPPYTCWEPKEGLSDPVITLLTIAVVPPAIRSFLFANRAHYALQHGYRMCEIHDKIDLNRMVAYHKLPILLALLPCTDYVVHVDGDAIITNYRIPLNPLATYMQQKNIDLLMSQDYIVQSPMNLGMMMMRPASWLYEFFATVYNKCTCDWNRNYDWPAEQGLFYDLLVENVDKMWINRTEVVAHRVWNRHWWTTSGVMKDADLVVHYAGYYGKNCTNDIKCKHRDLVEFYEEAVSKGIASPLVAPDLERFDKKENMCVPIHYRDLFTTVTYQNRDEKYMSSVMTWGYGPGNTLASIELGAVACLGHRDKICNVNKYWDIKSGVGPWMPEYNDVYTMMGKPRSK